jgi:hypothetical protein
MSGVWNGDSFNGELGICAEISAQGGDYGINSV